MRLQELIEQHRVHRFIADGVRLALDVAGDKVRINPGYIFGDQAELRDTGRIQIAWSIVPGKDAAALKFTWAEEDGPTVEAPTRRGFGSQIIEKVLAADFAGTVAIDYRANGLVVDLMAPVELGLIAPSSSSGERDDAESPAA